MNDNAKAMVLASSIGDALSLGVHWVYNTNVIDKKYGRVTDMLAPKLASFHRGKTEGDFTHYGDQTLLLLESVASGNGFDPNRFADDWRAFFEEYEGYIDKATQATQANFNEITQRMGGYLIFRNKPFLQQHFYMAMVPGAPFYRLSSLIISKTSI